MEEMVLTVHSNELRRIVGMRPFIALPQEEIDRLYASVEVYKTEHSLAVKDSSLMQLVVVVAFHYNYSWLTCSSKSGPVEETENPLSLGFVGHIKPDEKHNDIFLDESLKTAAVTLVNHHFEIGAGYDLRLSGLLCDNSTQFGKSHLGLVYISRLRQPDVINKRNGEINIRFYGIGDLQQNREQFDTCSKVLIDHLAAF